VRAPCVSCQQVGVVREGSPLGRAPLPQSQPLPGAYSRAAPSPSRSPYAENLTAGTPRGKGRQRAGRQPTMTSRFAMRKETRGDAPGRRSFEADLAGGAAARPSAVDNELLSLLYAQQRSLASQQRAIEKLAAEVRSLRG